MKVERFEQAHQLADGQLVTDANGRLWKVKRSRRWVVSLEHFSDEYAFEVAADGRACALGDEAPLPWLTVKVVPDEPPLSAGSTMCVCGDMAPVVYADGNVFRPHEDRKTGEPCPGMPLPGWPRGEPPGALPWRTDEMLTQPEPEASS